jgi:hypothetical protein
MLNCRSVGQSRSNHYGTVLIAPGPCGGYCTIDFERRCFQLGMVIPYRKPSDVAKYKGRAWKQKLVSDAVEKLAYAIAGRR